MQPKGDKTVSNGNAGGGRAPIALLARILALRALARVHRPSAERWAFRQFATPVRPAAATDPGGTRFAVTFRGRPLACWQSGSGPTILLSHGWSGHVGHMTAFIAPLVAAGFKVVAFDHPAHGSSPGRRTNMLEFRDALLAVAAAVQPVTAVIGHSLGATTAILALDRGLEVGKLALIAPPLDPAGFARPFGTAVGWPEAVIAGSIDRLRAFVDADLRGADALSVARRQRRPALLIHDRDDRAVPFSDGQAVADAWPGIQFRATSGLGHRRILSDPAVLAEVIGFIRSA
jgi:pimeloyl-ACP methyl ester carboxylesterase